MGDQNTMLFQANKSYGRCLHRTKAAAYLTGSVKLFQVIRGPIRIDMLGAFITIAIPSGANTLKFQFIPTGGTLTDLCGATDMASAGAQQLFMVDGVKATGLVKTTDVGIFAAGQALHMPIAVAEGYIEAIFSAGPPATGAIKFFMYYEPMAHDARVIYI